MAPISGLTIDGALSDGWLKGSRASLEHDLTYRKGVGQDTTDVYILLDAQYVYVAFNCRQSEPLTITQNTNDVGSGTDDQVSVALWPGGPNGFAYTFTATPNGTHYESSTENTAFSPPWDSAGKIVGNGFDVTMRIPRKVLHGDGRDSWGLQFERTVARNNMNIVWAYDPIMTSAFDPMHFGLLTGIGKVGLKSRSRPSPRVGVYGLGQLATPESGGNTSRVGLDFSLPVTSSAAFLGTLHPDYSEVEIDQQTIAPTIFRRQYTEVRPFFTQLENFFSETELYTPNIPTPSSGYAVEGTEDNVKFAAFDALGEDGRNDNAETVGYTSPSQNWWVREQRVAASLPDFFDLTQSTYFGYDDLKHWDVSGIFSQESGTDVLNPTQASYNQGTVSWRDPLTTAALSLVKIGSDYSPFDGYVQYNGTAGYDSSASHTWKFSSQAPWQSILVSGVMDVSHGPDGSVNYNLHSIGADLTTHNNNVILLTSGSFYVEEPGHGLVPFSQDEVAFNLAANPNKGASASYVFGSIYDGYAQDLDLQAFAQVFRRGTVTLEEYSTVFNSRSGARQAQALSRLSYTMQLTKTDSFSAGIRTINGAPAGFGPQFAMHGTNLSLAYSQHRAYTNLFVVYGDPNDVSTLHSFIVKLVQFFGAGQGS